MARHPVVHENAVLLWPVSGSYEQILVYIHTAPAAKAPDRIDLLLALPRGAKPHLRVALPGLACSMGLDDELAATSEGFGAESIRSWLQLGGLDDKSTARAGEVNELETLVRASANEAALFPTASTFRCFTAQKFIGAVLVKPTLSAYLQIGLWLTVWLAMSIILILRGRKLQQANSGSSAS
jgi:hypothetical protein